MHHKPLYYFIYMKRGNIFLVFAIVLLSASGFAQSIQGMRYQAIIGDSTNAMANTTVGMRISIIQGSPSGTVVYAETQTPKTDAHGVADIIIGNGTVVSGDFGGIDWANGPYYIKTEANPAGGINFSKPESLRVTYGLYAHGPAPVVPVGSGRIDNSASGNKHYVGEFYGGGIVFYVSKDTSGAEHGLIVTTTDLSTACIWSNVALTLIGPEAESTTNGRANTAAIIEQEGHKRSAALLCDTSTIGGQTDWYLPSMQEMNILWNNLYTINKVLIGDGKDETTPLEQAAYWTSTEDEATTFAWYFGMYDSGPDGDTAGTSYKSEMYHVRAIRAF